MVWTAEVVSVSEPDHLGTLVGYQVKNGKKTVLESSEYFPADVSEDDIRDRLVAITRREAGLVELKPGGRWQIDLDSPPEGEPDPELEPIVERKRRRLFRR